jgi:hypothetical protein
MLLKSIRSLPLVAVAAVFAFSASYATSATRSIPESALQSTTPSSILGTWTGTSTCVGYRPACKNETAVYRFVPVEDHPHQVRMLADKIIDGKRVVMDALVFEVDEHTGSLRSEFRRGQTHGVWSFSVTGDSMKGTLVILPESTVVRDVTVHRAKDDEVPTAPPLSDYDE